VSAPARLEGSVQRAVVAAADGFLQQANVRPGDRVTAGQVLAQLSSQDLELERKRRESELRQHEGGYRAAQARNDRTQMVISQSKAAETQALLTLAETQIDRTRLQAPFDGIVIKGDLSQSLGAPVQRGEVLMVLAPNDSFRLILEVDETDIAAIRPGQRGQLALAAEPDRPIGFSTRRIVPVATAADGRNYFEVEATPDASQAQASLRPGLSGVAKIEVGERSLGWLLFHRAVAWLRLSLWTVAL
jgi:multidrug resistance efflux pump